VVLSVAITVGVGVGVAMGVGVTGGYVAVDPTVGVIAAIAQAERDVAVGEEDASVGSVVALVVTWQVA
jgi:hypothetical protein